MHLITNIFVKEPTNNFVRKYYLIAELLILTKYIGFQYSVTHGTAVTRTEVTLC